MRAMPDCIAVLKGVTNSNGKHKLCELERLVDTKSPTATPTPSQAQPPPMMQPAPRVNEEIIENKHITHSMIKNEAL